MSLSSRETVARDTERMNKGNRLYIKGLLC